MIGLARSLEKSGLFMYTKPRNLYITSASCIVNAYPLYKSPYLRKKNTSFLIKMFL